jgi:hypothetical protein
MKRAPAKKVMERRKRPRSAGKTAKSANTRTPQKLKLVKQVAAAATVGDSSAMADESHSGAVLASDSEEYCQNCAKVLVTDDRALFVEEEMGRIFCSEACITGFFTPEIERLEKEYFRRLSQNDLTKEERESYSHLRWITLQEPDEIWREKTLSGDHRYTLISEFQPGNKKVWCVCICLFLKGEPSFLYLAFTTRNAAMVNAYRRGERVEWAKTGKGKGKGAQAETDDEEVEAPEARKVSRGNEEPQENLSDRLADEWTDDETFLAQVNEERREDDIPVEEFAGYEKCLEETLETPDEVWSCQPGNSAVKLYHFIRHYQPNPDDEEGLGHWYLIIARETEDEEQIEILDAFPTRDSMLVDRYRRGDQEVGHTAPGPATRVVH